MKEIREAFAETSWEEIAGTALGAVVLLAAWYGLLVLVLAAFGDMP